ncbi:general stress protein 26 [Pseudonocardia hierapolitana]|uniref:General stress protein 26 n=1 Tax=Pseudonocardia hierapolitana TaxID=1128676 RepID=A0A561T3Q0_9PSEU|nr:pyridoxamine 5'-phosphate oxidase family protein [Pseudonocardia hierapolitana]TWF81738.1 general stress protein 26 [Pseudonocardia hierapolitana]
MSSTTSAAELTAADREFLAAPRLGFLTVAGGTGLPEPRPVWFEVTEDGAVQLFSLATSPKVRRVRQDPRASLVAANAFGEQENWIAISGTATVEQDGAGELATRLGARYWDLDDPEKAAALTSMVESDLVRIVIRPERISRYGG